MALTDLTRISTSGIATGSTIDAAILRKDVSFRGTQVGVTSALFDSSDNALEFNDNVKLKLGDSGEFEIFHRGTDGVSIINETGSSYLSLGSNGSKVEFYDMSNGRAMAEFFTGGACSFKHGATTRFQTTQTGAVVTGILTATSFSGPVVGNTNNSSGISTFYDLRVSNNLTVEGTTTTLDTNLIGVDRVEVGANSNTVTGIAVTQSGTADIVRLYDGTSQVVTVDDVGNVGLGSAIPSQKLDVAGNINSANITISSATPFIRLVDTNPSGQTSYVIKDTNSTLRITDYTNDVDRLTIHGNGSVFVSGNFNASSGIDITGLLTVSGNSDLNGDLDVDGRSELDIVNIAETLNVVGISTFSGNVNVGGAVITNPTGNSLDFSGSITASDVVTAGALLHEGDTDTLVHFTAGDTIELKTGGTSRLAVTNSGLSLQNNATFNTNGGRIILGDSTGGTTDDRIVLGNSNDLFLYHDSTNSYIENNTGILKILGNTIQLGDGTDNVGIGTTNPTAKLDVFKSTNDAIIKTRTTTAGAYFEADSAAAGFYGLKLTSGGTGKWFVGSYNSSNFQIKDGSGASGAEAFTIKDSSGNIGIGTGNPVSSLHIWSTGPDILLTDSNQATDNRNWSITAGVSQILRIQAQNDSYGGGGQLFDFYRSGNDIQELRGMNAGNYWFVVDNNTKKVGIGTDNPLSLLSLGASANPTLEFKDFTNNARASITGGANGQLVFTTDFTAVNANSDFIFRANSATNEIVRFRGDSGNVGINESNPVAKLHIRGSGEAPCLVLPDNTNPRYSTGLGTKHVIGVGQRLDFYTGDSGNNNNNLTSAHRRMSLTSQGKLGIGTSSPSTTLDVFGSFQIKDGGGRQAFHITETAFTVAQTNTSWTSTSYDIIPLIKWSWISAHGDHLYFASGGNTAPADQASMILSDQHGFKFGRSGWDGASNTNLSTEYFRIGMDGNVGIGTQSPGHRLHVQSDNPSIALESNTTTGNTNIVFGDIDSETQGRIQYHNVGDYMRFHTLNYECLRFGSKGNMTNATGTWRSASEKFVNTRHMPQAHEGYSDTDSHQPFSVAASMWHETAIRGTSDLTTELFSTRMGGNGGIFVYVEVWFTAATSNYQGYQALWANANRTGSNNFTINNSGQEGNKLGTDTAGYFDLNFTSSGSNANERLTARVTTSFGNSYVRCLYKTTVVGHDYFIDFTTIR